MHFRFLLADSQGDIELSPRDLDQPFRISPEEQHPFLTLKDYFGALQKFIMRDDGKNLICALAEQGQQDAPSFADISEVLIRSEKHGAFYHIASIALSGREDTGRLAVTTALSKSARRSLREEFTILRQLAGITPDYLPRLSVMEPVSWQTESCTAEFLMVMGEWLEGYHEWHLNDDRTAGRHKIRLWDYDNGYRSLSEAESFELLRQAAYILTLYYDQGSFRQIYPWHHGAGDFVVKAQPNGLSVKLITARQYEPLVHFGEEEEADRLVAAIHFLLNLAIRIRLDRLDGIGAPAWFDQWAVLAAVQGFFAGLAATAAANRLMLGPVADFLAILQSFETREIYDMYDSLLAIYAEEDGDDFHLIRHKLADHAAELHAALKDFVLEKG